MLRPVLELPLPELTFQDKPIVANLEATAWPELHLTLPLPDLAPIPTAPTPHNDLPLLPQLELPFPDVPAAWSISDLVTDSAFSLGIDQLLNIDSDVAPDQLHLPTLELPLPEIDFTPVQQPQPEPVAETQLTPEPTASQHLLRPDYIDPAELKRISNRIFAIYNPKEQTATSLAKPDFRGENSSNVFETQLLPAVLSGLLGSSHGYLILEGCQGSGKSTLARLLVSNLNGKEILVGSWDNLAPADCKAFYFSIQHHLRGDFLTSIEILDERIAAAQPATGLKALGHWATRDLNVRHPGAWCKERMFAYLSGIRTVNQSRILLVLDGLDETFEGSESQFFFDDFLPERLPEGVYILLTCHRESCSTRLSHRLQSIISQGAQVFELSGTRADYRSWRRQTSFSRLEHRMSSSMQSSPSQDPAWLEHRVALNASFPHLNFLGIQDSDLFPTALEAVFHRRGEKAIESVISVASIVGGFTQPEMEELGLVNQALELVALDWPTLLTRDQTFVQSGEIVDNLAVAHDMIRQAILENYPTAYSRVCGTLAHRATDWFVRRELEMDLALISQSLDAPQSAHQHRSQVRMTLRLYSWLLDSQDIALQQESLANGALRRARVQVCNDLDSQGRFHEKLEILVYIKQILAPLVDRHLTTGIEIPEAVQDSFREELAWTRNSRALTYLRLGQFERSLAEVDQAIAMFSYLIEERSCLQYRQGLAAALNRRSEALLAHHEPKLAYQAAQEAVDNFRWFVEQDSPGGPTNKSLASLAFALCQRGTCLLTMLLASPHRQDLLDPSSGTSLDQFNVERDLGESIELYRQLDPLSTEFEALAPWSKQSQSQLHGRARLAHSYLQVLWSRTRYYLFNERFQDAERDLDEALRGVGLLRTLQQTPINSSQEPIDGVESNKGQAYEFDLARLETDLLISKAAVLKERDSFYDALDVCDRCAKLLSTLVQAGRLELRYPYSELLVLRASVWSELRGDEQAQDDLEEAANVLGQLIESESSGQLYLQRSVIYQRRALLFEKSDGVHPSSVKPWESALAELDKASEDLLRYRAMSSSESPTTFVHHSTHSVLRDPNNFELSHIYEKQGKLLESIRLFGRAADRYGEAIALYEQDQRSPLQLAKNLISRAGCYQQLQQSELALEDYELAIQRVVPHLANSSDCRKLLSQAHLQKARIWEQSGEHERAIREASRALNSEQADGDNKPELLLLRARLCLASQLDTESEADLEEALRLLSSQKRGSERKDHDLDSSETLPPSPGLWLSSPVPEPEGRSAVPATPVRENRALLVEAWKLYAQSSWSRGSATALEYWENALTVAELSADEVSDQVRDEIALELCTALAKLKPPDLAGERIFDLWGGRSLISDGDRSVTLRPSRAPLAAKSSASRGLSPSAWMSKLVGAESVSTPSAGAYASTASVLCQRVSLLCYEVSQALLAKARHNLKHSEWRKAQQETDLALRLMNLATRNEPKWQRDPAFQLQAALLYSWNAHCCLELVAIQPAAALQTLARTSLKEAFRRLTRECRDCELDAEQLSRWQSQLLWASLKLAELEEFSKEGQDPLEILLEAESALQASKPVRQSDDSSLLKLRMTLLRALCKELSASSQPGLTSLMTGDDRELTSQLQRVGRAIADSAPARQKLEALLVLDRFSAHGEAILAATKLLRSQDPWCLALADIGWFQHLVRFGTRQAWNQYLDARTAPRSRESQNSRQEFVDDFGFRVAGIGSLVEELNLYGQIVDGEGESLPATLQTLVYFCTLASQPEASAQLRLDGVGARLSRLLGSSKNQLEQVVWLVLLNSHRNAGVDEPMVAGCTPRDLDSVWAVLNGEDWSSQPVLLDALAPLFRDLLRRVELSCSLPREAICEFEADINQLARSGLRQTAPWLARLNLPRQIFWNLRRW